MPVSPILIGVTDDSSAKGAKPIYSVDADRWPVISLERIIGLLGVLLIVSPKINLTTIAGQTAGLRVDDILILCAWIPLLAFVYRAGIGTIRSYGYIVYVAFAFLSMSVAWQFGWQPHLLYPLRLVEYATFLFFGAMYARHFRVNSFLWLVVGINALAMTAQYFGLLGGFTAAGYQEVGRVVGLTAGPWEIGYMLNVIYALLVARGRLGTVSLGALTAGVMLLLLITGSRSATVVFFLTLIAYMLRGADIRRMLLRICVGGGIIVVILAIGGEQVFSRSQNILASKNIEYVTDYVRGVSAKGNFRDQDFENVEEVTDADQSWIIRSTHWIIALKEWSASPVYILFGVGPGTFGPALDGAWVRLMTETGVIGLLLYLFFLVRIRRVLPGGGMIVLATAANMMFIDIHLSYKSMALLLFLVGCSYEMHQESVRSDA